MSSSIFNTPSSSPVHSPSPPHSPSPSPSPSVGQQYLTYPSELDEEQQDDDEPPPESSSSSSSSSSEDPAPHVANLEPPPSRAASISTSDSLDPLHPIRWGDIEDTPTTVSSFIDLLSSLDTFHLRDLRAHLYSFHLLKRSGLSISPPPADSDDDEALQEWRKRFITKQWTQWPLPAAVVPRTNAHAGLPHRKTISSEATYTYKREDNIPGKALEELLVAQFLEQAKMRIKETGAGTVALDDEESERVLKPLLRGMLRKLDELLLGLSRERENYARPLLWDGERKEKWRKLLEKGLLDENAVESGHEHESEDEGQNSDKRPRKRRKRSRSLSENAVREDMANRKRRLRPRDWSIVLGMAAVKGWEAEAVRRTAERCTKAFGGDMEMETFGRVDTPWKGSTLSERQAEEKIKVAEDGFMCEIGAKKRKSGPSGPSGPSGRGGSRRSKALGSNAIAKVKR